MKILITSAQIVDSKSKYHKKTADVLISNGKIDKVGKLADIKADKVIDGKGKILSTGWFDMRATIGDPGFEYKEDFTSAADTAFAGGFTGVAVLPNTKPVVQTKNDIKYVLAASQGGVAFHPIGAVTIDNKGEDLTEMIDLHTAGAVAFSDGKQPIWHTDILLKSLQYLQKFDGLLIDRPEDIHLNMFGVMNEGISSTSLGMKGMPNLAEDLIVQRNLEILAYAGGRLHLSNISSAGAIALIKNAKKKGLNVTCDIASFQTAFTDNDLHDFDTNLKVNPPFREEKDNKALLKALQDGTIDVIVSSHVPQDEESKKLEFDLADFGIISLQTVAADIVRMSQKVDLSLLIEKVTDVPRALLGLSKPTIEVGELANLTLLDPKKVWVLEAKSNQSKSKNSPYWNQQITGKVVATIHGNHSYIDK